MAEAVGLASGLVALASFAFQSSVSLYETVRSFQSHQQRIQDLVEELSALSVVLAGLTETIEATSSLDLSALKVPLLQCGNACEDFKAELLSCSSKAGSSRMNFRGWAKLKYMGDDVDAFRRLLASYKMTVNIALTDANLRQASATTESLEAYNSLIDTTRADWEERLDRIDERLAEIVGRSIDRDDQTRRDVQAIERERLSTVKCLEICAQMAEHIKQMQIGMRTNASGTTSPSLDTSEQIASEGIAECRESLNRTVQRLRGHERQLLNQLLASLDSGAAEDRNRVTQLRDQLEATQQGVEICTRAFDYVQDNVSTIDNYATGDAVQFMVSTGPKTLHGKNRGLGWRTRQVGGHMNDETVQQIAKSFSTIAISNPEGQQSRPNNQTQSETGQKPTETTDTKFKERFGDGFKLTSDPTSNKNRDAT